MTQAASYPSPATKARPAERATSTARPLAAARRWTLLAGLAMALLTLAAWYGSLSYYGTHYRGWDAQLYYAHLRSAVIDHDLGIANELTLTPSAAVFDGTHGPGPWGGLPQSIDGQPANPYTIGSAVIGLPAFLTAHAWSLATGSPTDGYARPYEIAVTLWYGLLAVLGATALVGALARRMDPRAAAIGVVLGFLGTNVLYYAGFFPLMNHAGSFAALAALTALALRLHDRPAWRTGWLAAALLAWLVVLSRPTDAVLLLVLAPAWLKVPGALAKTRVALLGAASVGLAVGAQLIAWRLVFGEWETNAYTRWTGGQGFDFTQSRIVDLLFSGQAGGWFFHPLLGIGFLGLLGAAALGLRKGKPLRGVLAAFVAAAALHALLYSFWISWDSGASFGNRIFVNSAPLMMIGLAWWASRVMQARRKWLSITLAGAVVLAALLWNALLLYNDVNRTLPMKETATTQSVWQAQVGALQALAGVRP
ncbi:MAG: hypothetical protein AAF288_06990 [Planctomycetota bacterium]